MSEVGTIVWVSGPVVRARLTETPQMMEQVAVGAEGLVAELIGIHNGIGTIQVYEDTTGLHVGDPVYGTGNPLSVELGPGLIGGIYDGIQRPLTTLAEQGGDWITRGLSATALSREAEWRYEPLRAVGEQVTGGAAFGTVPETPLVEHRVLAPPGLCGEIVWCAPAGHYRVTDPIARVRDTRGAEHTVTMLQRWPVRTRRPIAERLMLNEPLVTGQRVIDILFPLAKGGTATVPGGFGAGKTVLQHNLAKWSDADVVVYIGCGERGNEITDVLTSFPQLLDPRSGRTIMERTILIANTSNMPVAAREASIYTGVTLAEYYRDMGYHVALMADSTSRWAEALREVSGRLEEMPAEEGFPAYLPSRLASFYERAGRVTTLSGAMGSVTIVGAVSPPGGDFSEPVTQHTRRFVRTFWALDKSLAAARHFPSINWLESYSGYVDLVAPWWHAHVSDQWATLRGRAIDILQQEARMLEIVRLIGPDALPDGQRFLLFIARLLKESFLQQNALDPVDAYTRPAKQIAMLRGLMHAYERGRRLVEQGAPAFRLMEEVEVWPELARLGSTLTDDDLSPLDALIRQVDEQMERIRKDYVA